MLEFPEVLTIAEELRNSIVGKKVKSVLPPSKIHKFCWYNGEPAEYNDAIKNSEIVSVEGFGIYVEIAFDNGYKLCFNDGVNIRLFTDDEIPKDYQLLIELDDESMLVFKVVMYGGIILHNNNYDNEYYIKSKNYTSPLSDEFEKYYNKVLLESKDNLSVKAFLATEQRFPGIGNGVLQDILFEASINPKRKISTLSKDEKKKLLECIIKVTNNMVEEGGRDTEKDIFGHKGSYKVKMSKNSISEGCPKCGSEIVKETYLGGSIYYCPVCQPLMK